MKAPSFEEAIASKDIFSYEVHRNVLGWQLTYVGENIAVYISKDEAAQILAKMENEDAAFDEQLCLDWENS